VEALQILEIFLEIRSSCTCELLAYLVAVREVLDVPVVLDVLDFYLGLARVAHAHSTARRLVRHRQLGIRRSIDSISW